MTVSDMAGVCPLSCPERPWFAAAHAAIAGWKGQVPAAPRRIGKRIVG
jgi:hypothetical protein